MKPINILLTLLPFFSLIPTNASECDFTPTTCSCSYHNNPAATCYEPVPSKLGACIPRNCQPHWKCDCFNPTHLCTRTTCTSYETVITSPQPIPTLTASEVACPQTSSRRCVSQTGQPIRPIIQLNPSPTPTKSPVGIPVTPSATPSPTVSPSPLSLLTCTTSSTCPTNTVCILGRCRLRGTCDSEMQAFCQTFGLDGKCCSADTVCARDNFAGDDSFCGTDCGESCIVSGGRTDCSFRNGGDTVSIIVEGAGTQSWTLDACSIVS